MIFIVDDEENENNYEEYILLKRDNWNDWWEYKTLFSVHYVQNNVPTWLGNIKIGFLGENYIEQNNSMKTKKPNIPNVFSSLVPNFFSLGQDLDYYKNLIEYFGEDKRIEFLTALGDIAFLPKLYDEVANLTVTRRSVLREVARSSAKGQFRRLANGNAELSKFNFSFNAADNETDSKLKVSVTPNALPPTNIHALIGRNGVGKTYFLTSLINYLYYRDDDYGEFEYNSNEQGLTENEEFANLLAVSFSAFDNGFSIANSTVEYEHIKFDTIGWTNVSPDNSQELNTEENSLLHPDDLYNTFLNRSTSMFILSLQAIQAKGKSIRWKRTIEKLYSDPMFKDSKSSELMDYINLDEEYIKKVFKKLSSGHKIVLLTLTQLIEKIEERSLVILDEPELHLHPPLLSAFIRALSDVLIYRNAVAVIATHSPVVLQEVPKKCVSIIDRLPQTNAVFFRSPEIETFGNNVGILTSTVFNLEVSNSGFYAMLKRMVTRNNDFEEIMSELDGQLGPEGISILLSLINESKKREV